MTGFSLAVLLFECKFQLAIADCRVQLFALFMNLADCSAACKLSLLGGKYRFGLSLFQVAI